MSTNRSTDYLTGLIRELCKLPRETEWAEFKENDAEPETIGEYLSALANSAALAGKAFAYLIWGVRDSDHAIVGTRFSPLARKVGNEELENWLLRVLLPKIHFRFFSVEIDGFSLVILEVERAFRQPVQFQGREFVRVGTYKKPLKDFPEKERALWRLFDKTPRERFGIEARNSATASRLIKEAVAVGAILPYDTEAAPKLMRYLPFWAAQTRQGGAT